MIRVSLLVALGLALALPSSASASDVKFSKWKKDPGKDRLVCEMTYPAKDTPTKTKTQYVVAYTSDPVRKNFYYFATTEGKIWGRCVAPPSKAYDKDVMQWSKMSGDKWVDLPKGECPAPSDGDPKKAVIEKIPDPPID